MLAFLSKQAVEAQEAPWRISYTSMWRRPDMQKRVVEEIRQAVPDPLIFPTYEKANKLVIHVP
jgi:hypothetical protein